MSYVGMVPGRGVSMHLGPRGKRLWDIAAAACAPPLGRSCRRGFLLGKREREKERGYKKRRGGRRDDVIR